MAYEIIPIWLGSCSSPISHKQQFGYSIAHSHQEVSHLPLKKNPIPGAISGEQTGCHTEAVDSAYQTGSEIGSTNTTESTT